MSILFVESFHHAIGLLHDQGPVQVLMSEVPYEHWPMEFHGEHVRAKCIDILYGVVACEPEVKFKGYILHRRTATAGVYALLREEDRVK